MFGKKKQTAENLLNLSETDLQNEDIKQLHALMERCCCNVCGGEVVLKKVNGLDDAMLEAVPYCLKCGRTRCAIDTDLYSNRINLLVNDMIRSM